MVSVSINTRIGQWFLLLLLAKEDILIQSSQRETDFTARCDYTVRSGYRRRSKLYQPVEITPADGVLYYDSVPVCDCFPALRSHSICRYVCQSYPDDNMRREGIWKDESILPSMQTEIWTAFRNLHEHPRARAQQQHFHVCDALVRSTWDKLCVSGA